MKLKPRHPAQTVKKAESVTRNKTAKSSPQSVSRITLGRRKKKKLGWRLFSAYVSPEGYKALASVRLALNEKKLKKPDLTLNRKIENRSGAIPPARVPFRITWP